MNKQTKQARWIFDESGNALKGDGFFVQGFPGWRFPFLFNKQGQALTGKPLLIHHEPQSGLYFYLGLQPVTKADYYESVCKTVLLPQAERGKLIDQHYKVNVKHWHCIDDQTLKELFHPDFVFNHDLFETQEISLEKKAEIYEAILEQLPQQVRQHCYSENSSYKIFEEFKKFSPTRPNLHNPKIRFNYVEANYLFDERYQKTELSLTYDVFAEEVQVLSETEDWTPDMVQNKLDQVGQGWEQTLDEIHERLKNYYIEKEYEELTVAEKAEIDLWNQEYRDQVWNPRKYLGLDKNKKKLVADQLKKVDDDYER